MDYPSYLSHKVRPIIRTVLVVKELSNIDFKTSGRRTLLTSEASSLGQVCKVFVSVIYLGYNAINFGAVFVNDFQRGGRNNPSHGKDLKMSKVP